MNGDSERNTLCVKEYGGGNRMLLYFFQKKKKLGTLCMELHLVKCVINILC